MLSELVLRFFQSHEKLRIKLDPHVTTVVGPSDRGKSAVIRALRWLATNKPGGDAFVKSGSRAAKVTVRVDGHEVRRVRGKARNTYHLDGRVMKSFGADVPQPVADLLNLADINFQGQHDAPFWFSESAGTVSRSLNAIIDLGVIDEVLAALNARQREATVTVRVAEEQANEAAKAWRGLRGVKQVAQALEGVERLAVAAQQAGDTAHSLHHLGLWASELGAKVENAAEAQTAGLTAVVAGDVWEAVAGRARVLSELLDEYRVAERRATVSVPDLSPVVALNDEVWKVTLRRDALSHLCADAERLRGEVEQADAALESARKKFKAGLGERCPLCDQKV